MSPRKEVLSPFFCSCCLIQGDPISAQKEETEKEPDTDTSHFVPFLFLPLLLSEVGGVTLFLLGSPDIFEEIGQLTLLKPRPGNPFLLHRLFNFSAVVPDTGHNLHRIGSLLVLGEIDMSLIHPVSHLSHDIWSIPVPKRSFLPFIEFPGSSMKWRK